MSEYLYIGTDPGGLFKIGITNNIKIRFKQHKASNPYFMLLFVQTTENSNKIEQKIKREFPEHCTSGEWYAFSFGDFEYIFSEILNVEMPIDWWSGLKEILAISSPLYRFRRFAAGAIDIGAS